MTSEECWALIEAELKRQHQLKAGGKFPFTLEDDGYWTPGGNAIAVTPHMKLAVLTEEICESMIARSEVSPDTRAEVIQVAACASAWYRSLTGSYPTHDWCLMKNHLPLNYSMNHCLLAIARLVNDGKTLTVEMPKALLDLTILAAMWINVL